MTQAWKWVQPKNTDELLARLVLACDTNVCERERENLCGAAHAAITRLQKETLTLHAAGCAESERADAAEAALHESQQSVDYFRGHYERTGEKLAAIERGEG